MSDDQFQERSRVKMIERVTVAKFDKTLDDDPQEPVQVVVQETITEISESEALLMGWKPKEAVEATGTVEVTAGDEGAARAGD